MVGLVIEYWYEIFVIALLWRERIILGDLQLCAKVKSYSWVRNKGREREKRRNIY
jgi:hypothetical protein